MPKNKRQSRIVMLLLLLPIMASAGTKTLTWTNATEYENGTPFNAATQQEGVRIYCDGAVTPTLVSPGALESIIGEFAVGFHTCAATTLDIFGAESVLSISTTFEIVAPPPVKPNPPTGLRAVDPSGV